MISIGDWVTQYSAGYWQVLAILPKYAEDDYISDTASWRKGDQLGYWAILKKGFTPKMTFSNYCECVDISWCTPVSQVVLEAIENAFLLNPKAKTKFDKAPKVPKPSVTALWLKLNVEQESSLETLLSKLPERFTLEQLRKTVPVLRELETPPPADHILYLFSHPWEMNIDFELLYHGPKLERVE